MAEEGTRSAADPLQQSYDETPYQDQSFPQFDVARLLGFAQLFGLADPTRTCEGLRVLDLGCASGLHLRDQARRYPGTRFVGIDFAQSEIDIGRKAIANDGLDNVELIAADLRTVELEAEGHDLILCHGIFSWVPDDVKERILLLCRQGLAPRGMAAIAYLTYPGWKQREAVRELLAMRDRPGRTPEERVRESALMLRFLQAGCAAADSDPHARSLKAVVESMQQTSSNAFLHDELGEIHDPCYFMQFVEWAAECGLQYLTETDLGSMTAEGLGASAGGLLAQLDADFLETQQLLDFVVNRSGRSSLMVRDDADPVRSIRIDALEALRFATGWWNVTPLNAPVDAPGRFENDLGRSLQVDEGTPRWLLSRLTADREVSVPFDVLSQEAGEQGITCDELLSTLAAFVVQGVVEPRAAAV